MHRSRTERDGRPERHTDMQASAGRGGAAHPRGELRILTSVGAALLACVLALVLSSAAHAKETQRHRAHAVAVIAPQAGDSQHVAPRPLDLHAAPAGTAVVRAGVVRAAGTADTSTFGSSSTAQTPAVRGPPPEALA